MLAKYQYAIFTIAQNILCVFNRLYCVRTISITVYSIRFFILISRVISMKLFAMCLLEIEVNPCHCNFVVRNRYSELSERMASLDIENVGKLALNTENSSL